MPTPKNIYELRYTSKPGDDFMNLLGWGKEDSKNIWKFVWLGYDDLVENLFSQINIDKETKEIERQITQLLVPKIRKNMSGYEPFGVEHGPYEYKTAKPSPSQPPEYDIAFVLNEYPAVMLPLEAKVLKTDKSLAEYIKEIKNNFLTCRYAPFSSEGAMIGYLLQGSGDRFFENLSKKFPLTLSSQGCDETRLHKVSEHQRKSTTNEIYLTSFRCHHLIMYCSPEKKRKKDR